MSKTLSLGVSQHMQTKEQTCANLDSIGHQSCERSKIKETTTLMMLINYIKKRFQLVCLDGKLPGGFFLNSNTSEGAISHNVFLVITKIF